MFSNVTQGGVHSQSDDELVSLVPSTSVAVFYLQWYRRMIVVKLLNLSKELGDICLWNGNAGAASKPTGGIDSIGIRRFVIVQSKAPCHLSESDSIELIRPAELLSSKEGRYPTSDA
jgi:hypothetical protein